jgi:hypothetical protein
MDHIINGDDDLPLALNVWLIVICLMDNGAAVASLQHDPLICPVRDPPYKPGIPQRRNLETFYRRKFFNIFINVKSSQDLHFSDLRLNPPDKFEIVPRYPSVSLHIKDVVRVK